MGRRNGLREDLAQAMAGLNPRFFRFPGGCVAHGDGLVNMYRWKSTIGPLEERGPKIIETALAEAIHLTTLERNGDVVVMASYAPLFAREGFTQWNPNLIYFTIRK